MLLRRSRRALDGDRSRDPDPTHKECARRWRACCRGSLMLAIPVQCPLLSKSGQNVAVPRLSVKCRLCCKSPKMLSDKFLAGILNKLQSPFDVAAGSLPGSPVSLSMGDEVPSHLYSKIASVAQRNFDQLRKKTIATISALSGLV